MLSGLIPEKDYLFHYCILFILVAVLAEPITKGLDAIINYIKYRI